MKKGGFTLPVVSAIARRFLMMLNPATTKVEKGRSVILINVKPAVQISLMLFQGSIIFYENNSVFLLRIYLKKFIHLIISVFLK